MFFFSSQQTTNKGSTKCTQNDKMFLFVSEYSTSYVDNHTVTPFNSSSVTYSGFLEIRSGNDVNCESSWKDGNATKVGLSSCYHCIWDRMMGTLLSALALEYWLGSAFVVANNRVKLCSRDRWLLDALIDACGDSIPGFDEIGCMPGGPYSRSFPNQICGRSTGKIGRWKEIPLIITWKFLQNLQLGCQRAKPFL